MMYYCKDDLQDDSQAHSWLPIDDDDEIDSFCKLFGLDRKPGVHGTSMVIPLPKKELTMKRLVLGLISNWIVPILEGKLELEFCEPSRKINFVIDRNNIREFVDKQLPEEVWKATNKTIRGTNKINPAWISKQRVNELIALYDGFASVGHLELNTPSPDSAPTKQWNAILPDSESLEMDTLLSSYNAGKFIHIKGKLPVELKKKTGQPEGPIPHGEYRLIFRKCEDEDAAEAHFYRDQISIPGFNNRKPLVQGVSSLLVVSGGSSNPLAEMLRQSEGPAHITWKTGAPRLKDNYRNGPGIITFLKQLVTKLVHHISSSQVESQSIWTDIFSLGPGETDPPGPRDFNITEAPMGGSCTITPSTDAEDMVGHTYIARIGYPKPAIQYPKKGTDPRNINVHEMDWTAVGAEITQDVLAENGELCVDRVRLHIMDEAFNIQVSGLAVNKRAQIILHRHREVDE